MSDTLDEFDSIVRRIEAGEGRLVAPPPWAIPTWPPSVVMNDRHGGCYARCPQCGGICVKLPDEPGSGHRDAEGHTW